MLVTSEFLFYHHSLSVYGVQLIDYGLGGTCINLQRRLLIHHHHSSADICPPHVLIMNHRQVLERTTPDCYELGLLP